MSRSVAIFSATKAELIEFATNTLGITNAAELKFQDLRAAVKQASGKSHFTLPDPIGTSPAPGYAPPASSEPPIARKMVKLIIDRQEGVGGDDDVQLGVNGRVMLVPRGIEVEIPEEYAHVLQNAVQHRYESLKDGGISHTPREVPLYPHRRIA